MSLRGYLAKRGIILGNTDEVLVTAKFYKSQGDPVEMIGDAAITVAALLGGIIEGTPIAASAYTLPTGAEMDAALTAFMIDNTSFEFTIINLDETNATFIITLTAAATGFTIVGQEEIESGEATAEFPSSGTFRVRKTAANTFVAYRL